MFSLSEGSLAIIMRGGNIESPVMQILGNKRIASTGANERFRLLVSDGSHLNSFAMLATQLNSRLISGELSDYSVVQINRYITSLVNNSDKGNKRVMIILELTVLASGDEVGLKIGNPVPLPEDGATESKPAPPQQKPAVSHSPSNAPAFQHNRNAFNKPVESPIDTVQPYPISSLNPYQNRWVIRARVTNKSPIRTWSNARGEGKLFSMELVDESGEIRATAFNDQCDKFYGVIEVNNVYFISRCSLKTANKNFTNLKNDYEMTFNQDTQVIPCHEDSSSIPSLLFNFVPLKDLESMATNTVVDVIGVCKNTMDLQTFIARTTNRELKKREVMIVDSSNVGVNVTLWGTQAEGFDGSKNPVLAIKGGKINEFGGAKSVSISMSTVVQLDPDIPEAHSLRGWYDCGGAEQETKNISKGDGVGMHGNTQWLTLNDARVKQLGSGDKADYFQCKAVVMLVRYENSIYKACPQEGCNKKVADMHNGIYRCEKCNQEFQDFKYRLLVSATLADWSSKQWVTAFQESAEVILNTTASKIGEMADMQDKFMEPFTAAAFKPYIFRLRCKTEMYNDETRMKTVVMNAAPMNYKEYSHYLLKKVKKQANMTTNNA